MRLLATTLIISLLLALAGCGSTENIRPPTHTKTATVQGNTISIFWLDERQSYPEKLTELVLIGDGAQYSSEYRWRKDRVREIQREGDVFIDGKIRRQSILIRYDSEGQAVYQQYRLDGDLLPLRTTELVRYFRQAEQALVTVRDLADNNKMFFQGYWLDGILDECYTHKKKALTFDVSFPDYFLQRLGKENNFIAAVGEVGRRTNMVITIIALDNDSACFRRPIFNN